MFIKFVKRARREQDTRRVTHKKKFAKAQIVRTSRYHLEAVKLFSIPVYLLDIDSQKKNFDYQQAATKKIAGKTVENYFNSTSIASKERCNLICSH